MSASERRDERPARWGDARDRTLDRIVEGYEQCIPEHECDEPHMCARLVARPS